MAPLPGGATSGAGSTSADQTLTRAVVGVVRRPRSTFQEVVSYPRWKMLLLATTLTTAAAGTALMATTVGRQALVDQWERTATAFGQPMDDAAYARLQELGDTRAPAYAVASALLTGPVLSLAVATALVLLYRPRVAFRQGMAVATYAGVILAIRQVLAAPISYLRESTANAMSVGAWLPMFDEASPVARFLGALDLFVVWWAIVLAVGVSVLVGRHARTLAAIFVGIYAAIALVLAIAMAVTGGSA